MIKIIGDDILLFSIDGMRIFNNVKYDEWMYDGKTIWLFE
jgi:hypothetical protein